MEDATKERKAIAPSPPNKKSIKWQAFVLQDRCQPNV